VTQNPWYLALFFGRAPGLPPEALRLLGLVGLGLFFENYDVGLVNAALPQIARGLGIADGDTGFYVGAIRLGGIGAFLVLPFADRLGRRRVFLASLVGMSAGTFATALSQTPLQFALLGMATRVFLLTASALALVILVEELPAERRGAAIGCLSVLGGLGFGLSAGLYAAVDLLPFGWRALYTVGVLPVLLLPLFRKTLRETRRFEHERDARADGDTGALRAWLAPVAALARTHPRRVIAIGSAGLLAAMGGIAAFQYTSLFVQNVHGWLPGHYTLLVLGGGVLGLFGNIVGGRGSDRFGRRRVGFACLALAPLFIASFYLGPMATLVVCWGLGILCTSAGEVVIRTLSAELFPTSHRGSATGWLILVQSLGWAGGLFLVGFGPDAWAGLAQTITAISLACAVAGTCLLLVPETNRRELEGI
jgi:MFS family permease